jgi:hypothetical protein
VDRPEDRIEREPANAGLRPLVADARRARPGEPYAIEGWDLSAHPDLEERLGELARGLPGATITGYRGHPVVVDDRWVVRALATGTSGLLLRLHDGQDRVAVLAHGGEARPDLGPDWVRADPWLSGLPSADGTILVRRWVAAALGGQDRR